jgi:hypothetical protein
MKFLSQEATTNYAKDVTKENTIWKIGRKSESVKKGIARTIWKRCGKERGNTTLAEAKKGKRSIGRNESARSYQAKKAQL